MEKSKCFFCGREFVKVCAHVWQKHDMQAREYKQLLGLDVRRGLIPDDHREHLSRLAIENNMPENLKKWGENTRVKKGETLKYERSRQTLDRLKIHGRDCLPHTRTSKIQPRACGSCGQEFRPKYDKAKYCGSSCFMVHRNRESKKTSERENKEI